jgi:hypothetical protein
MSQNPDKTLDRPPVKSPYKIFETPELGIKPQSHNHWSCNTSAIQGHGNAEQRLVHLNTVAFRDIDNEIHNTELKPGSEKHKVLAHLLMATETIVIQNW